MTKKPITRLLVVGQDEAMAVAMREAAASRKDLALAWTANETGEVLRLIDESHPRVVLLTHGLVKARLRLAIRAIVEQSPDTKILVVSMCNDSRYALGALHAGASGYMLQDRIFEELGSAVDTVMSGHNYLSPGIAGAERPPEDTHRKAESGRRGLKAGKRAEAGRTGVRAGLGPPARILVVDDEESIRETFRMAFERAGYTVVTASTGEEAIGMLRKELPDIAFVDLVMPGSSGVQVIRAIRERDKNLPVVVVTGYPDSELMYQAMAYSPLVVLAKPLRVKILLDTVRNALAGRHAQDKE